MIDAASSGTLTKKTPEIGWDLLEDMSSNNFQWPNERLIQSKKVGVLELDALTALMAQLQALDEQINYRSSINTN
ncbi:hypothetical protein AXF42_Ash003132 [Apostasia shenzhenica]|uniref:Uncharacterized protein n=1 Tax=Apostasia shenzhenica TaxID=1088818 RepID=A0A2I0BFA0_9ASPA|nr:hypothetical protein AXF42_Ash003132 [Apostasia shenzhenica]